MRHVSHDTCHVPHVTCYVSHVTWYLSPITCHLYQQPRTLTLLIPPLCTVGWFTKTKNPKKWKNAKTLLKHNFFPILVIHSLTRSLQFSRFRLSAEGKYVIWTSQLLDWICSEADSVKIHFAPTPPPHCMTCAIWYQPAPSTAARPGNWAQPILAAGGGSDWTGEKIIIREKKKI